MNTIKYYWRLFLRLADGPLPIPRNKILRGLLFGAITKTLFGAFLGLCLASASFSFLVAYHVGVRNDQLKMTAEAKKNARGLTRSERMEAEQQALSLHLLLSSLHNRSRASD